MSFLCSLVLAGAERKADYLLQLRRALLPEEFYQADHEIIFKTVAHMVDCERPVDFQLLIEELARRQVFEEVGGYEYIQSLSVAAPNYLNGTGYAAIVREKANLRRAIQIASDLLRQAFSPAVDDRSIDLARAAADKLSSLALQRSADTIVSLPTAAVKVLERRNNPNVRRVPTGIVGLDSIIAGWPKSKMTLIGADARVGKSALAKTTLLNQAYEGVNVGLVTVEEDREKVAENALAGKSGVANYKIARDELDVAERSQIEIAAGQLPATFFIEDQACTLDDVVAAVERLALKYKCETVVIDHLHLIQCRAETREQEIARISGTLKAAFKRLNVAGVVLVQLNRGQDVREKPTLRNLRGSGSLEADGDLILLLYRADVWRFNEQDFTPSNILETSVAKNKDGPMAEIPLHFDGARQQVRDPDPFGDRERLEREARDAGVID